MTATVHVVGAGIAGLACAVAIARAGRRVHVHEAAPHAGGRCRSFHDPLLDRVIDNGSHLVLGINRAVLAFLKATDGIVATQPLPPGLDFVDVRDQSRHRLVPGRLPASPGETLRALGLPWAAAEQTVAERLDRTDAFARLWQPLCLAALNTTAEQASARLFATVLRAALLGGRRGFQGWSFPKGLSAALVQPALDFLHARDCPLALGRRLTALTPTGLSFADIAIPLDTTDRVVLALPPPALARLLPGLEALPMEAIANLHYRLPRVPPPQAPLGLLGAEGHWLFVCGDVASVTVSAASSPPDAGRVWREIAPLLGMEGPLPPHRMIMERRATLSHRPDVIRRRPGPRTVWKNVFLAGDWLGSRWPCTLETAVSSGRRAAGLALGRDHIGFSW